MVCKVWSPLCVGRRCCGAKSYYRNDRLLQRVSFSSVHLLDTSLPFYWIPLVELSSAVGRSIYEEELNHLQIIINQTNLTKCCCILSLKIKKQNDSIVIDKKWFIISVIALILHISYCIWHSYNFVLIQLLQIFSVSVYKHCLLPGLSQTFFLLFYIYMVLLYQNLMSKAILDIRRYILKSYWYLELFCYFLGHSNYVVYILVLGYCSHVGVVWNSTSLLCSSFGSLSGLRCSAIWVTWQCWIWSTTGGRSSLPRTAC